MPIPRRLPLSSRLTADDLAAIGTHVGDVVREEVPKAIRTELVRAGLTVESDEDAIEVQADHAFLRKARQRFEDDRQTFRRQVITWLVPALCCALVAGLGWMLAHKF